MSTVPDAQCGPSLASRYSEFIDSAANLRVIKSNGIPNHEYNVDADM
jgi:hypothetical protein